MKIAYLFFAYRNPQFLKRTISALSSGDSAFFIHIDQKSDIKEFADVVHGDNVHFSDKRLPVYWAEFSGVEAILLLVAQALKGPDRYDYLVLLSGSEYPLRSRDYIHSFLDRNRGLEFISLVHVPNLEAGKPLSRVNTIWVDSSKPVRKLAMKVLTRVGLAKRDYRKHLKGLEPYSGNTWWALSREACQFIVDFQVANPRVGAYFKNVFAPEEMFFHTILGNSPFKSRIHRNFVYEDWSLRGSRPAMINARHVEQFKQQNEVALDDVYGPGEALFARKFSDESLDLILRLDEMISRKDAQ